MDCHPLRRFLKNQARGAPELKNLFAELIAEALADRESLAAVYPNGDFAQVLRELGSEISC